MAYKITRTQKITETLELSDKNGNVIDSIDIDLSLIHIFAPGTNLKFDGEELRQS